MFLIISPNPGTNHMLDHFHGHPTATTRPDSFPALEGMGLGTAGREDSREPGPTCILQAWGAGGNRRDVLGTEPSQRHPCANRLRVEKNLFTLTWSSRGRVVDWERGETAGDESNPFHLPPLLIKVA